jgi:tRNA pseudouridine55 synthase
MLGAEGPVAVFGPHGGFLALYQQRGGAAVPVAVFV